MLAEIGGGNSGVAEYLEKGLKQGRFFSRDELDSRLVLAGDLELTNEIINSIEDKGQERYLHITLSFRENEISQEILQSVITDYKEKLLSAYADDEYNFYAEAHLPKIKSVQDNKTGEMIERKPHIHIVIPEINLLTGNKLLPTGYIDNQNGKNIPYLDAIQEYINHKYNLASPKDFMREGGHHSANVLSRIKGDFFGEKQSQFKAKLVDDIYSGKINTLSEFQSHLSDFGEVKIRNAGKPNQYFAVKLADDKKFTNLKHPAFSEAAIVSKTLPKADIDTIKSRVAEWQNKVSKEIKFIDFATPTFRQQYAKANPNEKQQLLTERELNYERKYRNSGNGRQSRTTEKARGQSRNNQSNASNVNRRQSGIVAGKAVSLSSVQSSLVVHGTLKRRSGIESILPKNELNHLRNSESGINSAMRRNDPSRGRSNAERGIIGSKPPISTRSFSQIKKGSPNQTYRKNIFDKSIDSRPFFTPFERYLELRDKTPQKRAKFSDSNVLSSLAKQTQGSLEKRAELAQFATIRRNIDPNAFLAHLNKVYSVEPKNHKISYAKDGSPRFNVGKHNLNASDFLTKHLNLDWQEAKTVLQFCYANQANKSINQERLAAVEIAKNIKAFDYELRQYDKLTKFTLHNMNVDNRNAYREDKKRIYSNRELDLKKRNQELAIASFRCMQRQEMIDQFAKESANYTQQAKAYFQQSGYTIKSLEEFNMAIDIRPNSIESAARAAEKETERAERQNEQSGVFDRLFHRERDKTPINAEQGKDTHAKDIYQTQSGDDVQVGYRGNIQFKIAALQDTLKKNQIGVAKHTDGTIEYKTLNDGKLICTDDGEKMRIHQKDMTPENVKFFLEVSKDRYGDELKINGSKEFKAMVVEAAAANNLAIILKPAELQEQLMARRQELQMEQKVENINSIESSKDVKTEQEPQATIEPSKQTIETEKTQQSTPIKEQKEQSEKVAPAEHKNAEKISGDVYKIDFKLDREASKFSTGNIYSVTINAKPAIEAIKNNPELAKTLENVIANNKDLQQKGITANALASGSVEITTKLANEVRITKPDAKLVNAQGKNIQSEQQKSAVAQKVAAKSDNSL